MTDGTATEHAAGGDLTGVGDPPTDPSGRGVNARWRAGGLVLIVLALVLLARSVQQDGHGWGDDFALYINQARGLADGTADAVIADNRFALDNSAYRFGPIAYPWGFPALLAPIIALVGIDYAALKLVGTLAFALGTVLYLVLLEPRVNRLEALVATATVGLNTWYLGRTDQVLSDLPFWCVLLGCLVLLDRLVRARALLDAERTAHLVVLGAVTAFAFQVRREGAVLVAAVVAAQLLALATRLRRERSLGDRGDLARALATPHVTFLVVTALWQFVRPAPIHDTGSFGDPGLGNVRFNLEWYRDVLAEHLGLKAIGDQPVELFGHGTLGTIVLATVVIAAVVGLVAALVRDPQRDLHVVVTALGVTAIVLVQPFREGRYLTSIVPFVVYFAIRGLRSASAVVLPARSAAGFVRSIFPALVMALVLVGIVRDTTNAVDYHRTYSYTHWGPEDPRTLELFAAVRQITDNRDVVVFNQARTMNLYTTRRSIQGNSIDMMLRRGDWYAMTKGTDYIQTLLDDEQAADLGFVKVWENERFVLWDIPSRLAPP